MNVSGKSIVERMNSLGEIKEYVMTCGIPSSTISNWKNRNSSPKISDLVKIAEFKNVSLEWLVFGAERQNDIPPGERALVARWRRLSESERSAVDALISGFESRRDAEAEKKSEAV